MDYIFVILYYLFYICCYGLFVSLVNILPEKKKLHLVEQAMIGLLAGICSYIIFSYYKKEEI